MDDKTKMTDPEETSQSGDNFDPLLQCLVIMAKLHDRPTSQHALISGLPLEKGKLTPALLPRAAKRAKLSANPVKRSLSNISELTLPCILLLKNDDACLLTKINDEKATIISAESPDGTKSISLNELGQQYAKQAFFVTDEYALDEMDKIREHPVKHWFWDTIKAAWPVYGEIALASLLINLFALAIPLYIMNVYDRVIPNHALSTLAVLSIGIFIIVLFDLLFRLLRGYFIDTASKNIDITLSSIVFEQLLGLKLSARPKSMGTLSNTVQAFESFRELITSASVTVLIDLPFSLLFVFTIWYLGGSLAWVALITIPLVILLSILVQIPLNRKTNELFEYTAERQSILIETLNTAENLKVIGAESAIQKKWEKIICQSSKVNRDVHFLSSLGINFSSFMQYTATLLVVFLGVFQIAANNLTVGALIACTILTGRALGTLAPIAGLLTRYFQSTAALEKLDAIMASEIERPRDKTYLKRGKLKGEIEFRDVKFHYPEQPVSVLDGCSFHIKAGEKVGIIGRMGSGKSTLLRLISNLYTADSGNVLLDGTDIQQIDPTDLRHNMGFVPQNIMLFDNTIRENIAYAAPFIDDETLLNVARISTVDRYTKLHPDGLDIKVGEKGDRISGGQRQAIAIARSLVLDPSILLMDEPTNAMDDHSEGLFIEELMKIYQEKTLLLVTHRASALAMVDRLIVLDGGKIVADGPKEAILNALSGKTQE